MKGIEYVWDVAEKLNYVPLSELASGPSAGYAEIYTDRWWIVHPERGAIFFALNSRVKGLGSPQCNRRRDFVEQHRDRTFPGAMVLFVPRAIVPIQLSDYI